MEKQLESKMISYKKIYLVVVIIFTMMVNSLAQQKGEEGLPMITTYGIKEHGGLYALLKSNVTLLLVSGPSIYKNRPAP